jgi:hypothetical protein
MVDRHNRVALFAVVVCLFVGIVVAPALGPAGTADAATDDRQFQQTTNGSNRTNDNASSNASITLENQTTTGTTVRVRSVTLPADGFVTIHNSSYQPPKNESVDSIVGVSSYLDAGRHENVTVVLRNVLDANQTLTAVVHRDGNRNENFDYATANGFIDTAFGINGTPVSDSGVVTVQRVPSSTVGNAFEDRPTSPSVMVENQTLINDRLTVDSVRLPTYSYIVVHNSSYNASSLSTATIIGRTQQVRVGTFRNVTIELYDVPGRNFSRSQINETGRVYVSLYRDTNRNGAFDFQNLSQGTDAPYLNESGAPIVESVQVNTTNATGQRTATETAESTETTALIGTTVGGSEERRTTVGGTGGEAGANGGGTDSGGGSSIVVSLLVIGGIVAVLAVGWVVVGGSSVSGDRDVSALQQELARIRMAVSRYGVDMRAYGIPADWETLEIDLTEDDSMERRNAVEAFATIDGLDVTPSSGETADEAASDGFTHQNVTISLPRETVDQAEAGAAEGDERSKQVITALRRVLSAYYPDAVRATSVRPEHDH